MSSSDQKPTTQRSGRASADQVDIVEVPPTPFLMADGSGDPNGSREYAQAVEALYAVSYALRFALKRVGLERKVGPLEGLWWVEDWASFDPGRREGWRWTMMIAQAPEVTPEHVTAALAVRRKKEQPGLDRLRLETLREGTVAQTLHVGPYSAEGPTVARLHAHIEAQGYRLTGRHHEIYLSGPRRVAPERMRTVIRQPIARGG